MSEWTVAAVAVPAMASRTASAVETEWNRMFIVVLRRIAGIPLNDERGGWKSTISTTTTRIRRRPVRHYRPAPDHERRQSMAMPRSEEHTSELQSLMRISYAVFCLQK